MITGTFITTALLGLGSLAKGSPIAEDVVGHAITDAELFARTNYTIVDLQWEVQAFPDGPKISLNGTVEQIYEQLTEINPNFKIDSEIGLGPQSSDLERRTDFTGSGYFCGGRWPRTSASDAGKGIDYLYGVPGQPTAGPGPGACARVSCSGTEGQGAGIMWCNDSPGPKTLVSFGSIADGALYLYRRCVGGSTVSGQVFHKTDWNVVIYNSYC